VRQLRERLRSEERATILPLIAVLILVLFGFAAIGVDTSAAFAEKRQSQSAADAAVLAAALEYLSPTSPSGLDIAAQVKSYTAINAPGIPPSDADWAACLDPDRPAEYSPVLDTSVTPAVAISDCISLKQVNGEPALLRVRLPDWNMPTSFAGLIGFDTVAISATATAELRYQQSTVILPFSLPANPASEECLATPPSGLLPGDSAPCTGPAQGNFGILDSPWFGADGPHFTTAQSCGSNPYPNFNTRAPHNLALGLDHIITTWPEPPALPPIGTDVGNNSPGADSCANAQSGVVPFVLNPQPGNTQSGPGKALLQEGFLGDDPSPTTASVPGRLRQTSSPGSSSVPDQRLDFVTNAKTFTVDNVGLWEYLLDPSGTGNACDDNRFGGTGRDLTTALLLCLANGSPRFSMDLLQSPRFAVVPVLNYLAGSQYGNKWWPVLDLVPVYIQTSWYDCTNGNPSDCLFQPEGFANTYSVLFNPPCSLNNGGACVTPLTSRFQFMGLSALVLDWNMFPPEAKNQLGGNAPFEVFLFSNE